MPTDESTDTGAGPAAAQVLITSFGFLLCVSHSRRHGCKTVTRPTDTLHCLFSQCNTPPRHQDEPFPFVPPPSLEAGTHLFLLRYCFWQVSRSLPVARDRMAA